MADMKRIALGVEYDGTLFSGWQFQDGTPTVQAALEQALSTVADRPVRVICAGRTDAGVHAACQVVHFDTDVQRSNRSWVYGANVNSPKSVSVLWAQPVSAEFHARFSALRRRYRYVIFNRDVRPTFLAHRVTWHFYPLDVDRMQRAANYLLGEHDFSAYRAQGCQAKSPVRTVNHLSVHRDNDLVFLDIEANAFLHHMVRNIAGVLMAIGAGNREPEWAKQVLDGRDRSLGGITAPPYGLYLTGVTYPEDFPLPPPAPSSRVWSVYN